MLNPESYSSANKKRAKYDEVLHFLRKHDDLFEWGPDEVILDVGCGPGDITAHALQKWLPKNFGFLLGMDVSSEMIKFAQHVNSSEKVGFQIMDIEGDVSEILKNKRYSSGFDKVFSFYVLHWIVNLEKGLSNLYSVMKPGSQGLVTFPIDIYLQSAYRQTRAKEEWNNYFKNVEFRLPPFLLSPDPVMEVRKMLEKAGFQVYKCIVDDIYINFDSNENIKYLMASVEPELGCIPSDLKEQYLNDCVQVLKDMDAFDVKNNSLLRSMLTCSFNKPKTSHT